MPPAMKRLGRAAISLLLAVFLLGATLGATGHGHHADRFSCAACAFAGSAALHTEAPCLPPPTAVTPSCVPLLVTADAHRPAPLSVAPKQGPPAAPLA